MILPFKMALPRVTGRRLTTASLLSAGLLGFVGLAGWAFDIGWLKSFSSAYISIKVNTALAIIASAWSIHLLPSRTSGRRAQILGGWLIVLTFFVGLLSLGEYVFHVNLGIDELFFYDPMPPNATFPPGRMAPITAINFVLLSLACFFSRLKRYDRTAQAFVLVAFVISFQALVGYFCGVTYSFGSAYYTQMAVYTAFGFVSLCVAFLVEHRDLGLISLFNAKTKGGELARKLIASAILVPPVVNWLQIWGQRLGLFDADFGVLLRVLGNVVFFTLLVWKYANELHLAEKKHLESDEIRQNERFVRAILDSALDGIVSMDSEGQVQEWNPRAEVIFGWRKEEIFGKKMADFIIPEKYRLQHSQGLRLFLETGQGRVLGKNIEITALRKNGEEFPIELSISPIRIGDKFSFTAFIADISERKKGEEELKIAHEAALHATHAKSEFLANMSHEIRTPMNGVIGMTHLLQQTHLSPKQTEYLSAIHKSSEALLGIINDVLDFSKIESGKLQFEVIDFDLTAVVKGVTEILDFLASHRGNLLKTELDKDHSWFVKGDPHRLRQVLMNLVGNAIKFTEQGVITLKVAKCPGSDLHRFEVVDSGGGIPEAAQKKLFQVFTQADSSVTRKFGGTGLGLAISKGLVEGMKGKIGFSSELSKGSTFWFELPLVPGFETKRESLPLPKFGSGKNQMTVLLAEDNAVNQLVASCYLQAAGFKVTTADNGKQAYEAVKNQPFDLVLMDCQMPEWDGYLATKKIRELNVPWASTLPIIALTANAISGDREKCIGAGMNDYVTKPIDKDQLFAAIHRQLSSQGAAAKKAA